MTHRDDDASRHGEIRRTAPDSNRGEGVGTDADPGMSALIRDARAGWHTPPETPREEIWAGVAEALFGGDGESAPTHGDPGSVASLDQVRRRPRAGDGGIAGRWLAVAAAAVLLLGVGIGRMGRVPGEPATSTAAATPPTSETVAQGAAPVRLATAAHLSSTETLLSLVRADARRGELDPAVGRWGRRLLTETRLLLDSPAVSDPGLRTLLEELEVVLAQVALLADTSVDDARRRGELELIAEGLDEAGVESRLRASLPGLTAGLAETD